jgi:hypothetical protein
MAKPRCPKCGTEGSVVGSFQFFGCGWGLDDKGKEITPCQAFDEIKGGPEESMTPPSQNPFLRN